MVILSQSFDLSLKTHFKRMNNILSVMSVYNFLKIEQFAYETG